MQRVATSKQYRLLHPLFHRLLCTPATSAPVERIFSQSGIIMRPHRAKMSDSLLETLVMPNTVEVKFCVKECKQTD